jgi:hypothetical protein
MTETVTIDSRSVEMRRMYLEEDMSLQAIGDIYGLSRERVRQLIPGATELRRKIRKTRKEAADAEKARLREANSAWRSRCGTLNSYRKGCKCDECVKANYDYAQNVRKKARDKFRRGEIEIEHGTYYGYQYYECRCDECRTASSNVQMKQREERSRKLRDGEIDIEHGTKYGYIAYKCRCDACKEAYSKSRENLED